MKRRIVLSALVVVLLLVLTAGWFYRRITKPVIHLHGKAHTYLFIRTGSTFSAVADSLRRPGYLTDPDAFAWLARRKHYDQRVKPGRYRITDGMANHALINLLRSGMQEPVKLVIRQVGRSGELAGRIGRKIETDSARLNALFNDRAYLKKFGLTPATLLVHFIPNTYEFYWNTTGEQLMERMQQEFDRFWTDARRQQAGSLGLTLPEVVTLASIVEKESNRDDEKPLIAGVYLNRLRIGMPLQADPTLLYAWNDRRIKRVYKFHTEIDSPYNTYRRTGLPPGPICLPSPASVDAVLRPARHSFLYFCAREDLSGYHSFAADAAAHGMNARKYQQALNKLNIR